MNEAGDPLGGLEIRVGTVLRVEEFPEARVPAWKLWVDLGPEVGEKKSSARLTGLYSREELVGRQVVCVCNLPIRQIGPFRSEILVTGFVHADGKVVLAVPERPVPDGTRLA